LAILKSARERYLVGILKSGTHRDSVSDTRRSDTGGLQKTRDIKRRRFTLDRRIRSEDNLFDLITYSSFFQVLDVGERFPKHHTAASRGQADRNDIIHKSAVSLIRQKSEISVNGLFRLDESLLGNFASVLKF
jgi:predicted HTH domain antitoxin